MSYFLTESNIADKSVKFFTAKINTHVIEILNVRNEYHLNELILQNYFPENNEVSHELKESILRVKNPYYFYLDENMFNVFFKMFKDNNDYLEPSDSHKLQMTMANNVNEQERNAKILEYFNESILNNRLFCFTADELLNIFTNEFIIRHDIDDNLINSIKSYPLCYYEDITR
jgi:hypothetical protein